MPSILIVEDEVLLAQAMRDYLARRGWEPTVTHSGEDALLSVRESEPDIVALDFKLPGIDGLETLREIRAIAPRVEIVMLTAHGTVQHAVGAMRAGAYDYLTKPVDLDELAVVLDKAWSHVRMRRELQYLQQSSRGTDPRRRIVGDSDVTRQLRVHVERLAALDQGRGAPPVLITGETGTGKGLVARTIHDLSQRTDRPFVEVNCAAIPASLLESEMFGYERGAFTDARAAKPGLFEAADGGTLFLDEIGAMALELQVKLLKAIEDRNVRRLGGLRAKDVDVRIVAATNADLEASARDGTFRADLLYRLNVLPVALTALRDRRGDIVPLARHYTADFARRHRRPRRLAADAEPRLVAYAWPGNVRELANVVERAVLLSEGEELTPSDLGLAPAAVAAGRVEVETGGVKVDLSGGGVSFAQIERALIVEALRAAGGNRRRAAQLLDLSPETLRYRIEKHKLG